MSYSREKAVKKLEEMKKRRAGFKKDFYTVQPGANNIRILPNWNGEPDGDFFRETAYHKNLGPDRDRSVVCLTKEGEDYCPICDYIKKLYASKNKEDAELAKSIRAQHRVLFNMIDLDDASKGVQIWMTGTDILEQILGFDANPLYEDVTDPETGRNLTINFTEGKNTKSGFNDYQVMPHPEKSPLQKPDLILSMTDLDAFVKTSSVEEMIELIGGFEESEVKPSLPTGQSARSSQTNQRALRPETPEELPPKDEYQEFLEFKKMKAAAKGEEKAEPKAEPEQKTAAAPVQPKSTVQDLMARLRAERTAKS